MLGQSPESKIRESFALDINGKEIIRDAQIREIDALFGPNCRHIVVEGGIQVGKTSLLQQYAKYHASRAITYEITANPLQQRQHTFLYELCSQIAQLLGKNDEQAIDNLSTEGLKTLLPTQIYKLSKICESGDPYYLIIDGLEFSLDGLDGSRIIDVFPSSNKAHGPFILSSCRSDVLEKLPPYAKADRHIIPSSFGFNETKDYFSGLDLPERKIWHIQQQFQGTPGYLKVLYEILSSDPEFDIAGSHPSLESLVGKQVNLVLDSATPDLTRLLSYLVSSMVPLSSENLENLTGISQGDIVQLLDGSTLVRHVPKTSSFEVLNPLTRTKVVEILKCPVKDLRSEVIANLHSWNDKEKLAVLLRENDDYDGLQQLLVNNNIITSISNSKDIFAVMKQLQFASELAAKNGQLDGVIKWTLGMAALKSFAQHLVNENEIRALLSIGRSQDAIRMAYVLPDSASKIRMLASCYTLMRQRGEQITSDIKDELINLVRDLRLEAMDKDSLREIGFDLFPVVPDFAVQFLENVVEAENRSGIIDYAIKATLAATAEPDKSLVPSENMKEIKVPHLIRMYSTWLDGYSYAKLVNDVDSTDSVRAKEYLIRQWCRHNLSSEQLNEAILLWIDVIVQDTKFTIALRSLRQMSSYLMKLPIVTRQVLVRRFQAPLFTSLDSPKDEWIRFRLNLVEAVENTPESAREKLLSILNYIKENVNDLDSKTFALMCLKGSCLRLAPNGHEALINQIDICFQKSFDKLLLGSADHFRVLRKTLQAMVDISPEDALISAINLNTRHRRTQALGVIVQRLLIKHGTRDISLSLQEALNELSGDKFATILVDALIDVNIHNVMLHPNNLETVEAASKNVENTYDAVVAAINIIVARNRLDGSVSIERLDKVVELWNREEDLKRKIALGYKLVEEIGAIDVAYAENLYSQIADLHLQPGSNLAHGELGSFFVESLVLAIRSLNKADFIEELTIDNIYELINRIPASRVRVELYANLASAAFRNGYDTFAQGIVREKVLSVIEQVKDKSLLRELVEDSLPVIFRYDPQLADKYVQEMPILAQDRAWLSTIVNTLSNGLLIDLDFRDTNLTCESDLPTIRKSITLLSNLSHDIMIHSGISVIANSILTSVQKSRLDAYQAFDLLERIEIIADKKLPDNANIQHEGYLILAKSTIHKVRSLTHKVKSRAGLTIKDINRQWSNIITSASKIPNVADRVYVLTLVAKDMAYHHKKDRATVRDILTDAKNEIANISTFVDRIDRLTCLAEAWNEIGEASFAQSIFEMATEILADMEQLDRDQQLSLLVDSAYKINPDLADKIITNFDSRNDTPLVSPSELALEVKKLVANPTEHALKALNRHDEYIIMQAAAKLHQDLVNGMGSLQTPKDLISWIMNSQNHSPAAIFSVIKWVVESRYLTERYVGTTNSKQAEIFTQISLLSLELSKVNSMHIRGQISDALSDSFPGLHRNIVTFAAGEVDKAEKWLSKWLYDNAVEHLIICDPYFGPDQIQILRYAPKAVKVQIVTTDHFFSDFEDAEAIKSHMRLEWQKCSGQTMPKTQLFIVPKALEGQFHDRAIISKEAGLNLGQSLNGLAKKRGNITILSDKDAKNLKESYIDNMLDSGHWFMYHDISPTIVSI